MPRIGIGLEGLADLATRRADGINALLRARRERIGSIAHGIVVDDAIRNRGSRGNQAGQ